MKIILLIIALIALPLHAAELEIGTGLTKFGRSDNGTWWQAGNPHSLDLTSQSFKIGITQERGRWRSHVGLEFLGQHSSWCYATSDHAYFTGGDYPFSNYYGKGHVTGLYLTQGPQYRAGGLEWHPHAGLYAYRAKWTVYIPDWVPCTEGPDGPNCKPDTPRVFGVRSKNEILITPLVGLSVGRGNWFVDASVRTARGGQLPTITKGPTWNIGITYRY